MPDLSSSRPSISCSVVCRHGERHFWSWSVRRGLVRPRQGHRQQHKLYCQNHHAVSRSLPSLWSFSLSLESAMFSWRTLAPDSTTPASLSLWEDARRWSLYGLVLLLICRIAPKLVVPITCTSPTRPKTWSACGVMPSCPTPPPAVAASSLKAIKICREMVCWMVSLWPLGIRFPPLPNDTKWEPPINPPRRAPERSYSNSYSSSSSKPCIDPLSSMTPLARSTVDEGSDDFDPKETYKMLKKLMAKYEDEGNSIFENQKIVVCLCLWPPLLGFCGEMQG